MHAVLYQYDVYPKVFLGDTQQTITIQPYGGRESFVAGKTYCLRIYKVNQSNPRVYPERGGRSEVSVVPDADGCLRFTAYFEGTRKCCESRFHASVSVFNMEA